LKLLFSLLRRALNKYQLLEKNSRVLVGLSGGEDSLTLISLLHYYNRAYGQNWEIRAAHIDPQFPGWDPARVEEFCARLGIPCTICRTDIHRKIKKLEKRCFFCSRERRRRLLEIAEDHNIFKVALAHHQEDVGETLLLNLLYNGEVAAFLPKQSVIHGRFHFIRPLYFFEKSDIREFARAMSFPADKNVCPYDRESKRDMVRNFLTGLRHENPAVRRNLFNALFNIKKAYLP
jgi:tRNA 2-thiocytidine biosynthesis protein TtcA